MIFGQSYKNFRYENESLIFLIKYLKLTAGSMDFNVIGTDSVLSNSVYHLVITAQTNNVFSSLFNYLPFRLSSSPFQLSTEAVTLLYLVFILGAIMGPIAGRISNHFGSGTTLIGGGITALFSHQGSWESLSGMFSAVGNIGPCYISVDDMIKIHPVVKLTYIFGMLAGRLEILPVLMLFSRKAWK